MSQNPKDAIIGHFNVNCLRNKIVLAVEAVSKGQKQTWWWSHFLTSMKIFLVNL